MVKITYRTAKNSKGTATIRIRAGQGAKTLAKGSKKLYARAKANTKLRASRKIKVMPMAIPSPPRLEPPGSTPVPSASSGSPTASPSGSPSSPVDELAAVAKLRVFFGHQSVGWNLLEGVLAVYGGSAVAAPPIGDGVPVAGGSIGHVWVGQNYNPKSKLDDFDAWMRDRGAAAASDVAFMKLCYVDITAGFDAQAWFAQYRSKMAALETDFPDVTFLHVTAPLTNYSAEDNVARQRLNALLREEYGSTGRLFDLAAVESTRPDGTRVSDQLNGQSYYELYEGYTDDGGHLNQVGSQAAAAELVHVLAAATD